MSEFNLSEMIDSCDGIHANEVKEFIRRLKGKCCDCNQIDGECKFCIYIRELAGEKLI